VTISMYQASVPVMQRMLVNLRAILEKAGAFAEGKKLEPGALFGARLAPDMFPLSRQVQIASDMAKGCGARLAGVEPPKFDDNEASMKDLLGRIDKTLAFLQTLKPEQIDGSEDKNITLQLRTGPREFKGMNYLLFFALPNFYFHVTTAYDILRHNGVEIGKPDFLGRN
jgi:hypothetical protein